MINISMFIIIPFFFLNFSSLEYFPTVVSLEQPYVSSISAAAMKGDLETIYALVRNQAADINEKDEASSVLL
jgi:hypothetical protein